jgi:hypothetical protein
VEEYIEVQHMEAVKEIIEFNKGKGKASQKVMEAPSGQVGQVGWKPMCWEKESGWICFKAF